MSQTLRSLHRLYLSQYLAELQPTCIVHRSKRLTLIDDFDGPYLACELQHRCCGVTLGFPREGTLCFVCNTGPTLPTTDIHAMIGLNPICESCEEIDWTKKKRKGGGVFDVYLANDVIVTPPPFKSKNVPIIS